MLSTIFLYLYYIKYSDRKACTVYKSHRRERIYSVQRIFSIIIVNFMEKAGVILYNVLLSRGFHLRNAP